MDYKEKYERSLERAKEELGSGSSDRGTIEYIFPELKENEDERIRKELINYFIKGKEYLSLCSFSKEEILAWLEKQGHQEEPQVYETENGEVITYSESEGYKVVEPKFKVGDWITTEDKDVHEDYRICRICKVDNDKYYIENGDFFNKGTLDAYEYHLWTIQDAKDGDVLVYGKDKRPFIYKGLLDKLHLCPVAYCGICDDGSFRVSTGDGWWTGEEVYPATKEQRDLLFQKMKEAGYEWDAEKKELKKIELNEWVPKKGDVCKPKKGGNNILLCDQDGIEFSFVEYVKNGGYAGGKIYIPTLLKEYELVEPKDYNTFDISFNAKDSELQEASYYIPEGFHAEIDGNKVIIKKGEINNEERDSFIELCNDLQMRSTNESLYDELEKLKNWIKSL